MKNEIVIFRHAHALSVLEAKVNTDFERPISEKGKEQIKKSISNLLSEGFRPEYIVSSPFKRAVQTADIISNEINCARIEFKDFLVPGSDLSFVCDYINSNKSNIIIVSHMPFVSDLVYVLSGDRLLFSTGGYVRLEYGEKKNVKILSRYFPD